MQRPSMDFLISMESFQTSTSVRDDPINMSLKRQPVVSNPVHQSEKGFSTKLSPQRLKPTRRKGDLWIIKMDLSKKQSLPKAEEV
jgi:hypothetical protein